jgi:acetyl esterase/lipase
VSSARTSVLVIAGAGERLESYQDLTERHGERLGLRVTWREVDDADAAVTLLDQTGDDGAVVLAGHSLAGWEAVATAVETCAGYVVWAEAEAIVHPAPVHQRCDRVIHGRGRRSFTGALDHLVATLDRPPTTIAYGEHPAQVGDLRLPAAATTSQPAPVVVLLHGGYWLDPYERDLMDRLSVALTDEGWATWNAEYRRCGPSGGGWPTTLEDACAAVDVVADLARSHPIDADRVVLLGHSAGAQLGFYAHVRSRLPSDTPGVAPRPRPNGIVSLAGVLDLEAAADAVLGGGAITAFLGAPEEHPKRYRTASPVAHLPVNVPVLAIHAREDRMVPVDQTTTFVDLAREAGDDVEVAMVAGSHLELVDLDGAATEVMRAWLREHA